MHLLSCDCPHLNIHKDRLTDWKYEGGPKNNRNYFFKWFIRFCTIINLVSFEVLSFWLDTLVPTFLPLPKTFPELFSADVVQDLQHFLFHFADISKTFPFHPAFHTREQKKVAWCKVGWIGRMTDNHQVVFFAKNCCTLKAMWAGALSWWRNQSPLLHISGRWHELQDKPVISEISSMVRRWSALIASRTFSRFSAFRQAEGRPDLGWSSRDISPPLKHEYHSYTWVLLKASSLKASCINTVSAADFPNRKQHFTHTLCSLLSAIIKIAKLPSRHLEKKPQQQ